MRFGHLALIVFQAFWLNVVLPGHARGVVVLPGARCCVAKDGGEKKDLPAKRAANCAVCAFAARVTLPPVVDFTPPKLGLMGMLPADRPAAWGGAEFVATYWGRGPPAFC